MILTKRQINSRIDAWCAKDGNENNRALYQSYMGRHQVYWQAIEDNKPHNSWLKIQSYEADLAQYQIDLEGHQTWEWSELTPDQPPMPDWTAKPFGYYTQKEVDASRVAHNEWLVLQAAFMPSFEGDVFNVLEPTLLLRPIDITEPTVTPLSNPMSNVPEAEFTEAELEQQATAQRLAELVATDKDMIRISEDLYDFVVDGTPLPQITKDKMANRKAKREAL